MLAFDDAGALARRTSWSPGVDQLLVDEVFSGGMVDDTLWAATDYLGSVNQLVDNGGTVVEHREYDAFGAIDQVFDETGAAQTSGDIRSDIGFAGRQWDNDAELYYNRARWYEPESDRFISEDPAEDGSNWYAYAGNNPVTFFDPSGLAIASPLQSIGNFLGQTNNAFAGAINTGISTIASALTPSNPFAFTPSANNPNVFLGPTIPFSPAPSVTERFDAFANDLGAAAIARAQAETNDLLNFRPEATNGIALDRLAASALGNTRVQGGIRAVGGTLEVSAAAGLALVPVPGARVAAAFVGARGLDNIQAGSRQAYSGEQTNTLTYEAITGGALLAGADYQTAQNFGTVADIGADVASTLLTLKIPTASRVSVPQTALRTNAQLVDDIGTRAGRFAQRSRQQATFADLSPQTVAIKQHDYARRVLDRYQRIYGDRGLSTEKRFLNGLPWEQGQPLRGSIRLDVVEGPLRAPTAVFDYKFGSAGLSTGRINQVRAGAGISSNVPIIEIRP